jgi:hypothetical protein
VSVLTRSSLKSSHTGVINGLLGDGSVPFLSQTSDLLTLQNLAGHADGQVLINPF